MNSFRKTVFIPWLLDKIWNKRLSIVIKTADIEGLENTPEYIKSIRSKHEGGYILIRWS